MKIRTRHRKAIDMLGGCPDGATEAALAQHGITLVTLEELVAAGLVRELPEYHRRLEIKISRFHIVPDDGERE